MPATIAQPALMRPVVITPTDPAIARRARLLRFVDRFGAADRRAFRLRLGDMRLPWKCLTDEALETVASDMVSDFWFEKKINRVNRAIHARRSAALEAASC